jgi:hypothetical protein
MGSRSRAILLITKMGSTTFTDYEQSSDWISKARYIRDTRPQKRPTGLSAS